jgi:alginate O-acetyltransferase complex protein AlgI
MKKINLLVASYLVYAAWNLPFVLLLWLSTMVDWWVADGIFSPVADAVYFYPTSQTWYSAWLGTLALSGQIFCDFDGCTLCAIGAALSLEFTLPDNFRFPYGAVGLSDSWRRWHISLSQWLRDYLYIAPGGNRGTAACSK